MMKIKVNRDEFLRALSKVAGVVERRQTLPILGNFLVHARNDTLEVVATDLEVEIRAKTECKVETEGVATVPGRKLVDICRAFPEGFEVSLRVEKERANLASGRSRFHLSTLPAADFPMVKMDEESTQLELKECDLKKLVEKTAFAMAQQDVRYYLNGMLVEIRGDRVITVATDGHRLAKVELPLETDVKSAMQIILPRKTVMEVNRILRRDGEESVRIQISERMFRMFFDEGMITTKVVDGRYPDYEKVIPRGLDKIAYANREVLREALMRAGILLDEKFKGVKVVFDRDVLKLIANNPEQEEAEEEVEISYADEKVVVGFNVGYLIDVMGAVKEEEVEIAVRDSSSSTVIRGRGNEEETYVVMPMRL